MKINHCLTEEKKLLLKIIFEEEEEKKLLLWQKWYKKIDIENDIDSESYHLLPLLYYSLSSYQIKTEEEKRLKGIYRRSWYKNQLHYKNLQDILASFNQDNILPIILGDLVMATQYYQEIALRPIYKYELFVLPNQINLVIEKLEKLGWKPTFQLTKVKANMYSKLVMNNVQGNCLIVYEQLWIEKLSIKSQEDILSICQKINIGDYQSYILKPIPQVLAICLENIFLKYKNLTRFVVDLKLVLINDFSEIDGQILTEKIKEYKLNYSYTTLILELSKIKEDKMLEERVDRWENLEITACSKDFSPDVSNYGKCLLDSVENLEITALETQELAIIENINSLTVKDKIIRMYLLYCRTYGKSNSNLINSLNFLFFVPLRLCERQLTR
ncbi:nucleotidyltransferase family protein [Geminocystis sp. GBBB08]|uniref:nucleotidyltransferase family protein n=1 Tax=Geminocystis sp. GBBB08 TaxID=2604140 RepID=UPI0027E2A994|nr:nucleotidyltransferase family protein [Geminocystis sp. GBBB08]MBL1209172.1 nucleotidyltransferase family protein [Geminocystis sp. GBBB08]